MNITSTGLAFTTEFKEAKRYQMMYKFMKMGGEQGMGIFKMHSKHEGRYYLPVNLGKQHMVSPKGSKINPLSDIMLMGKQNDALSYIVEKIREGEKSAMIVSETATGKSYLLMSTAFRINKPTVIVAPRKGILTGLYDKFGTFADIKIMTSSEVNKITHDELPSVLLISAASFNKCYDKLNDHYDVLLLDEVHRSNENRVSQINRWKGLFVMGVSGTPQRKEFDIKGFEMLFKNIYYTGLKSLPAKILSYEFDYEYSLEEITQASEGLSPTHPEIYRRLYIPNKKRTEKLIDILRNIKHPNVGFKRIIIFTDRTTHINIIYEELSKIYDRDKLIIMDGKNNIEDAIHKANSSDEYIIIGQMSSSGEGVDITNLELGILFQSTRRINTIEQAIGRMKRKYEGKESAYFIDFIDCMRLCGSKKKKLGRYDRNRIYKDQGYEVEKLSEFLNRQS